MITSFNCSRNSLYIDSILYYDQMPFSIHNLWIEIVDANTSRLMVKWNIVNKRINYDLSPFWTIFDSIAFERGLNIGKPLYPTLEKALIFLRTKEIKNQFSKNWREKYLAHRNKIKEQRRLYWSLKKDEE